MHALYLNGLGTETISNGERKAIKVAEHAGFAIEHHPIDWLTSDFETLLDATVRKTEDALKRHGAVVLIGASAGGSLAVNTYGRTPGKHIYVVTLCSRLHEPGLAWCDLRTLERMAHIGTRNESRAFLDSIKYCQDITLPGLTSQEKQQIITVKQWADEVVPRPTMNVSGLPEYIVPGFGHYHGIVSGIKHLATILDTK